MIGAYCLSRVVLITQCRTTTPPEVVYNNTDTSSIHYQGDWGLQTIANAPSTSLTAPLHLTTTYGSSATLNFTGEAVAVYGFRVYGNWLYNVVSSLKIRSTARISPRTHAADT